MTELDGGEHSIGQTEGWFAPEGADPFNHFMVGYFGDGTPFRVPAMNQVTENLWQGGFIDGLKIDGLFDEIISLYKWEKYETDTPTTTYTMYDGGTVDAATVSKATEAVLEALGAGKRVFVHCQAGLNRSSLVVGNVLIKQGMKPEDAIALMREKRSSLVLFNYKFEQWLLAQ